MDYLATIVGGTGPDTWEKELNIVADDIMDAAAQACGQADEMGGYVFSLDSSDRSHLTAVAEGKRLAALALDAVDAFMAGAKLSAEQIELQKWVVRAGCFGAAAYDVHQPKGGGEYHAMNRAFLLALADPMHEDLDYLRAEPAAGQDARDGEYSYIKEMYGTLFKVGMKVVFDEYSGEPGVVIPSRGNRHYVSVKFDSGRVGDCHPESLKIDVWSAPE